MTGLMPCTPGTDAMAGAAAEVPKRKICTVKLDEGTAAVFRKAVKKHYWHAGRPWPMSGTCICSAVSHHMGTRRAVCVQRRCLSAHQITYRLIVYLACRRTSQLGRTAARCLGLFCEKLVIRVRGALHSMHVKQCVCRCPASSEPDLCLAGTSCSSTTYLSGALWGRRRRSPRMTSRSTSTRTRALTSTTMRTGCAAHDVCTPRGLQPLPRTRACKRRAAARVPASQKQACTHMS